MIPRILKMSKFHTALGAFLSLVILALHDGVISPVEWEGLKDAAIALGSVVIGGIAWEDGQAKRSVPPSDFGKDLTPE